MQAENNVMPSAWSNGRWIYLDLSRNRYFGGHVQRDMALQEAHFAEVTPLRDLSGEVSTLVPTLKEIRQFVRSARLAWRFRRQPIRVQIATMQAAALSARRAPSAAAIEHYAVTYQHMRNLRFRRPLCLEDSMACALFLKRFVEAPTFCIGVKQPPFMAHAWVQVGDWIVNDTKDVVGRYSRILSLTL